jgi:hypothetical protein
VLAPGAAIRKIASIIGYKNASKNYRVYKSNIAGMVAIRLLKLEATRENDRKSL